MFTIDLMSHAAQVSLHLPAAIKRMPCVFGVDIPQQNQLLLVGFGNLLLRINRGSGDTREFTLPAQ